MARTLTAWIKRHDVPSRPALQMAIKALSVPLSLDETYAPFETAGYLPCTLDGEDAGFDLRFKEGQPLAPELLAQLDGRDVAMICKWGGDPREDAAASLFCAALVKNFGALAQQDDAFVSADALLARAEAVLE